MNNLIKKIKITSLFLLLIPIVCVLAACQPAGHEKKIGIIIPIQHKAMDEIVAGFTETLRKQYSQPLKFKIANAQGDLNLQRAIIQKMRDENDDLIIPIGTVATQMTASVIHHQPIISLAATYSEKERNQDQPCHMNVVHDEISPQKIIDFIHQAYPSLSHLVLIHSASDKIFPDVKTTIDAGKKVGIEIKSIMVPTLTELYSVANALPLNTQGILVLKDNLIVSGISTLIIVAAKRHIPLLTSDQGSVQDGATMALGVHERDIGVEGAKLAAAVLSGQPICGSPMVNMTHLTVFMNQNSLKKESQVPNQIQSAAKQLNYTIEFVNAVGK